MMMIVGDRQQRQRPIILGNPLNTQFLNTLSTDDDPIIFHRELFTAADWSVQHFCTQTTIEYKSKSMKWCAGRWSKNATHDHTRRAVAIDNRQGSIRSQWAMGKSSLRRLIFLEWRRDFDLLYSWDAHLICVTKELLIDPQNSSS